MNFVRRSSPKKADGHLLRIAVHFPQQSSGRPCGKGFPANTLVVSSGNWALKSTVNISSDIAVPQHVGEKNACVPKTHGSVFMYCESSTKTSFEI